MLKWLFIPMLFAGCSAFALTQGYVVVSKTNSSSGNIGTIQSGSIYDTGTSASPGNIGIGSSSPNGTLDVGSGNAVCYGASCTRGWSVKTSNYTAVNGDNIIINTTSGAFTVTFPSNPAINATVTIKSGPSATTKNLTLNPNGKTIQSVGGNMTVSTNNVQVTYIYDGTTWRF